MPVQKVAKQRKARHTKLDPVGQLMVHYIGQKYKRSDAHAERHVKSPPDEDDEILFLAEQNIYKSEGLPNHWMMLMLMNNW